MMSIEAIYATDVTMRLAADNRYSSRWCTNGPGRPPRDRRQIVNGLLLSDQDGVSLGVVACMWAVENRMNVRRWSRQGVWPRVLDQLTQRASPQRPGIQQSAGPIDSQTIKTANPR